MGSDKPTLLLLHALGAVSPSWWAPRLERVADLFVTYREDLLDGEDDIDVIEGCSRSVAVVDGDDFTAMTLRALGGTPVDGVVTFSEAMLAPAAALAATLGKPHHPLPAVTQMQRKDLQRQVCDEAQIPGPRWTSLTSEDAIEKAQRSLRFPVVLKPAWGFGSSATIVVDDPDSLPAAVVEQRSIYQTDWRLAGHATHFVAEEYMVGECWHADSRMGRTVSVESLMFEGEIVHLTVTDKFPPIQPLRETGDVMPSWLSSEQQSEVTAFTTRCLRALGAYHGATHTELRLTAEGPRLIEVNARLGGYVAGLMDTCFDYDIVTAIANVALGRRPLRPGKARCFAAGLT